MHFFHYKHLFLHAAMLIFLTSHAYAADIIPMTLDDCVRTAISQSPRIKAKDEAILKAESEIGMARSSFFPTVTAFGTAKNVGGISSTGNSDSDYDDQFQKSYGIQLNQTIFAGLTILNSYQRSVLVHKYSIADKEDAISRLRLEVETTFLDRLRAIEELKVYEAQDESLTTNAKAISAMFQQNLVAYSDVLKADLQVANNKQQLSETKTYISGKTIKLKGLMHIPFEQKILFYDNIDTALNLPEITIANLRTEAVSNNPSIILAQIAIDVSSKDKEIAFGSYSPRVTLQASYNNIDIDYAQPGVSLYGEYSRDYSNTYSVAMLNFEWNLFSGGNSYYQTQRYRHEINRLQNNLQDQINTVYTDIESAYNSYMDSCYRANTALQSFKTTQEQLAMANSRLAKSLGTLPELMLAKAQHQNAKSSLIIARIDTLQALANLYMISGTSKSLQIQ